METLGISPEFISVIVGSLAAAISSAVTWLLARRKYNAEVNGNVIENMQKSLEFYKQLSDDNSRRLKEMLDKNNKLEDQIRDLQRQVMTLTISVCTNLSCALRERDATILNLKEGKGVATTVKPKAKPKVNEDGDID